GIVALIVIGPKDLPGMFRTMGQFTGKARGMAREFSRAMEAAADESGIKEMSNTLRAASDPKKFGTDALKNASGFSTKSGATPTNRQEAAAKAADPLATDSHESAARAKVPAEPATTAKPAAPKAASAKAKPAATAAKPAATPKPAAAPKVVAKPKAAAKPKPATAKKTPAKSEDKT
ncbi:twin-arginine translocase TatA/TatE family subunit, partial [Yoonia sp.]|uniref:Sec-independent protein translocase subunit TatA/TatB n=1 Tax=Yoonia sp. TaxID=2212373 RepID=UPI00391DF3EB